MIFLYGCRTAPIYNVKNQTIVTNISSYTENDVKKAIVSAGIDTGWSMNADKPGHMLATFNYGSHIAKVDIDYNRVKYSITYRDSINLRSDGKVIHKNYNLWVQELNRAIGVHLNKM